MVVVLPQRQSAATGEMNGDVAPATGKQVFPSFSPAMDLGCDDHTAHHTVALSLSRVSGGGVSGWQTKVNPRYLSAAFQTPSSLTLGKNIELSSIDKSIGEDHLFTLKNQSLCT